MTSAGSASDTAIETTWRLLEILLGKQWAGQWAGWFSYPLVMTVTVCELENGPVEIVDLPIYFQWWILMIFPVRFLYVYQRVIFPKESKR
jgi:hypothetical protein